MLATSDYFISRNPDVEVMLKWIEKQGDIEITSTEVERQRGKMMIEMDPVYVSHQLWGYLNLNLVGEALNIFRNVTKLNGAEAWRRVTKPINSQSVGRRQQLRQKAWNPQPARNVMQVDQVIEEWETNYRKYIEARGDPMSDESRRELLAQILPGDLSTIMMVQLHQYTDYNSMKLFVKNHVQLLKDKAQREKGSGVNTFEDSASYSDTLSEPVLEVECDMSPEECDEINAVYQKAGQGQFRKRFVPRTGGQGVGRAAKPGGGPPKASVPPGIGVI